ncbi:uncharacterized protein LOC143040163 isoform X2 [Oratosquilla oratoria]|uniref:uncharacterized protein LOC143040163 isoform X2 n=1 Tax=Oratosquilla oratoria TaxID=337810 RepID=UPI003F772F41
MDDSVYGFTVIFRNIDEPPRTNIRLTNFQTYERSLKPTLPVSESSRPLLLSIGLSCCQDTSRLTSPAAPPRPSVVPGPGSTFRSPLSSTTFPQGDGTLS